MIMCTNDVEAALRKVPLLCKGSRESAIDEVLINGIVDLQPADGGYIDCTKMVGFEAVYRVCFGMTCFYWLFMLLMLCVRSSRDPRAGMQNGFWGIKFVIFICANHRLLFHTIRAFHQSVVRLRSDWRLSFHIHSTCIVY